MVYLLKYELVHAYYLSMHTSTLESSSDNLHDVVLWLGFIADVFFLRSMT